MTASRPHRLPHVALDLASRNRKALKIERLLGMAGRHQPLHILEIGTGSGGIAHYFGTHHQMRCEVTAVDVSDNRLVHEGYSYRQVQGVELPFDAATFDVIISNHVIEHVGDAKAQARHLAEIRRVMKPDGDGYLAVPNRWMLTEPHYRLMFLSWWPPSWRTPYLRLMRKGEFYDCEPLEKHRLERMLSDAGLGYRNLCIEALRETLATERPQAMLTRWIGMVPDGVLKPLRVVIPTLIYRLDRR